METSFTLLRLPPHLRNRSSRLIKSPKVYLSDIGLCCWLAGIKELNISEPLYGAMWESYVAQNLQGILSAHSPDVTITYWNIQGRYEVDFIIETGNKTIAVEVKTGSRWQERDLLGLKAYLSSTKICRAAILAYNGSEVMRLDDKIWVVPLQLLLS